MNDITVIVVNYKTEDLTRQCVETFRAHYPTTPLVVVDNGSDDDSTLYVRTLTDDHTTISLNSDNLGHGPAMHQEILTLDTPYFFTLDSDCVTRRGGFLELMLERFKLNSNLYAIGWLRYVHPDSGVAARRRNPHLIPYVHPSAALHDRLKYLTLPPFYHRGAPCVDNMREATVTKGYDLESFPIAKYIKHLVAGTRRMWRGDWNPGKRRPNPWSADARHKI